MTNYRPKELNDAARRLVREARNDPSSIVEKESRFDHWEIGIGDGGLAVLVAYFTDKQGLRGFLTECL